MYLNFQKPIELWTGFKHSDTQSEAFTWLESYGLFLFEHVFLWKQYASLHLTPG